MKPANFPARRYARRLAALERLAVMPPPDGDARTLSLADRERQMATLQARLLPGARAVRTKKDRTSKARISR